MIQLKAEIHSLKINFEIEKVDLINNYEDKIAKIKYEYLQYKNVAEQEVKVNECIRYQQRIDINKYAKIIYMQTQN